MWGDVTKNLSRFDRKVAAVESCDIILLPEMFASGCITERLDKADTEARIRTDAAQFDRIRQVMSDWAREKNAMVIGSAVCTENGCNYNRLIAALPDGSFRYYDKRHCFRMGGEDEHFSVGTKRLLIDFRGVRIAPFVCYDLRFPVWSRNTDEYDLAVYIANWPSARREAWQVLLRARALENQSFVAGVNCVGSDNAGLTYAGDSAVIDAGGAAIGSCRPFEEETEVVEIDVDRLHQFRHRFDVLKDRDAFTMDDSRI